MTYSVAVSGASGYAGGEILRILAAHPDVEIRTVTAHSNAGQPLIQHQPHLRSLAHLTLQDTTPEILAGHDIVFRVTGTGKLKRRHTKSTHLRSRRSSKLKRQLGRPAILPETHAKRLRGLMGMAALKPKKTVHERALAKKESAAESK